MIALTPGITIMFWIISLLLFGPQPVQTSCDCGYTTSNPWNNETWLFTELLETDFTKLDYIQQEPDWIRQNFHVSAETGRGEYGKTFLPQNVVARPELGIGGQRLNDEVDAGLEFIVSSSRVNDSIIGAEVDSARLDLHYGSYRAGIKVPRTNGTCAAFFWYFNDTQEVDMEFLSREFDPAKGLYPINLVIQSKEAKEAGYDASETGMYKIVNLTFDPTTDFHEYRFDYIPGHVFFYVDSELVADMQGTEVPSVGGHLILQHWSNGNPLWSGGPPSEDASLKVNYVKAYFNSSDPQRLEDVIGDCPSRASNSAEVCSIPDITAPEVRSRGEFLGGNDELVKASSVPPDGLDDEIDSGQAVSPGAWTWKYTMVGGLGPIILINALL